MKDLEHSPLSIERVPNGGYRLTTEMAIKRGLHDVFEFSSDPHNLKLITPKWLTLRVRTSDRIEMAVGTRIRYRFRVHRVPAIWQSEITAWEPPYRFVDEQRIGPFRWWSHEHLFEETEGGTLARDNIIYGVPLGGLVHNLFVERDLRRLFTHRHRQLRAILET